MAARGLNSLCLYLHSVETEERGFGSFLEQDHTLPSISPGGTPRMFSCSTVDACSFLSNRNKENSGDRHGFPSTH